jgi:hypothetical protein
MMKAKINVLPATLDLITLAMRTYRRKLEGYNQRLFDIAYNKVSKSTGELELDGMELEYICRSLRACGWVYKRLNRLDKAEVYFTLAAWVTEQKREFQQTYGPKVDKPRFEVWV